MPHGLTIDSEGHLWLTVRSISHVCAIRFVLFASAAPGVFCSHSFAISAQDCGLHQVFKYTMAGEQLLARARLPLTPKTQPSPFVPLDTRSATHPSGGLPQRLA